MPPATDHIDINKTIPHRARPFVKDVLDPNKPVPHVETLDMSWAVLDLATSQVIELAVEGGHFESLPGHRYLVVIRAADVHGVRMMTLDGSGMFRCATDPDRDGIFHEAVLPLPASVPHQQFSSATASPTLQSQIVIMKPDIGAFDYFRLSAGFHHFNGTAENLEYFAYSGIMTFSATATNARGDRRSASLTTGSAIR
jgi:hypothetical protein